MNTRVSPELEKPLKEKGFVFKQNETYYNPVNGFTQYEEVPPTIADVVMWLYKKHEIWISVYQYKDYSSDINDPFVFRSNATGMVEFDSPTEAYEAAFIHLLNNVI